ncbi:copper resistance D family protein [Undibacterium arcticum]|uniref:Copper resistance D family protein n=1 Tax=Undibacterium arcticum TaxID=1762892 RepID=A0ABV7F2T1_9BURK
MTTVSLFQGTSTVLLNASLAWMTGAFFARNCLRNCSMSWCDKAMRRLDVSVLAAAGICITSSFCTLWAATAVMNDSPLWDARDALWTMLTMTHYGRAGLCGLVTLLGIGCAYLARDKLHDRRTYDSVVAALLLIFAFTRAIVSHAVHNGMFEVDVWLEWLHLLLIGLWAGGVMVSGWMVLPWPEISQKVEWRATTGFLNALSRSATIALVGIAATGAYNAYRGLGSLDNLSGNAYGRALTIKLWLVALAVGLGAFNRFIGFPAVVTPDSRAIPLPVAMHRLVFILRLESFVLLGVLIAAAALSGEAPPALS